MESKRDLAINQVPITTKHLSLNYGTNYKPVKAKGSRHEANSQLLPNKRIRIIA